MAMPTAATAITVTPPTGCGSNQRPMAAQAMAPVTTSSTVALISAAMIEVEPKP